MISASNNYLSGLTSKVVTAQSLLGLRADGIWGSKSKGAFRTALPSMKSLVIQTYEAVSITINPDGGLGFEWDHSLVSSCARLVGVPEEVAQRLVQVESGFNAMATSATGYVGLTQLGKAAMSDVYTKWGRSDILKDVMWTPWTKRTGLRATLSDWYDPKSNLLAGLSYLRLMKELGGFADWPEAYMAYNLGVDSAKRALKGQRSRALAANIALSDDGSVEGYVSGVRRRFSV